MIKHSAILAVVVAVLVGSLLYSMSPDEVRIAYSGIRNKVSDRVLETLAALHWRALRLGEIHMPPAPPPVRRDLIPDPFQLHRPRQTSVAGRIREWVYQPETLWLASAVAALLWFWRRARKQRVQIVAEQKMSGTLVRAVHQMSGPSERRLRTIHDS
jgi:hypothetical protein